ncbi:MAG: MBL fold metallo-hydrolase [Deltaproteobacteria bacterium]
MRICTLASGSSGNSLYIESKNSKILVDAGISLRQITQRLNPLGVSVSDIDAVIVTHEHTDHASCLPHIGRPVYVAGATIELWKDKVSDLREFSAGTAFWLGDLFISPFSIPHDAADPVGFAIEADGKKIGIATDIGMETALVRERLKGSNALVLEFNHDEQMLLYSSYPWELKQRIKSRLGHLSNSQAAALLENLVHGELRHVVLAHLSEANNRPNLAMKAAEQALEKKGAAGVVKVSVAPRKTPGEVILI